MVKQVSDGSSLTAELLPLWPCHLDQAAAEKAAALQARASAGRTQLTRPDSRVVRIATIEQIARPCKTIAE